MRRNIGHRSVALLAAAAVLALAGCAGESTDSIAARAASIGTVELEQWGTVLVDAEGAMLYSFEPDEAQTVSCTFTCATNWPPYTAVEGELPDAAEGVDPALIGTLPNPGGGEIITYNGWPLYRYAADREPGEVRGQNTNLNGGRWYVMSPGGEPVEP